jgi:hypothetical protein
MRDSISMLYGPRESVAKVTNKTRVVCTVLMAIGQTFSEMDLQIDSRRALHGH